MTDKATNDSKENPTKFSHPVFSSIKKKSAGVVDSKKQTSDQTNRDSTPNDKPPIQKNGKWKITHTLTVISIIVNAALLVATYLLWQEAIKSGDAANKAAIAANKSAEQATAANELAKESAKSSDELNQQAINVSEKSLDEQINSLNESRKQFELESRAFLSPANISIDTSKLDKPFQVNFVIVDMGKFPANIVFTKMGMAFSENTKNSEFIEQILDRDKSWIVAELSEIVSSGTRIIYDVPSHRALTPIEINFFKKGEASIYLKAEFRYISFGVNKKYSLKFCTRITRVPNLNKLSFQSIEFNDKEIEK